MFVTTQLEPDVLETPPFPVWRFSVDDYHRLADMGLLAEEDRVELLEGWIVPKMVKNPPHDGTIGLVDNALRTVLPQGCFVRIQSAITTNDSEPEPDIAVIRGELREFTERHPLPDEIELVVEVSQSSLAIDRRKSGLYGRAGIACYWIVNLVDSQIEVFSDPTETAGYAKQEIYKGADLISLLIGGRQIAEIAASELLP